METRSAGRTPITRGEIVANLRIAVALLAALTALTGIVYPLAVTGLARVLFPAAASGSLVALDGAAIGSRLVGQEFRSARYFWGRPSATVPLPYNGAASSGSNLGPLNPRLREAVAARVAVLHSADPENASPVPVDLVTASASGLDPDISLAGAMWQAARVARERRLSMKRVTDLIRKRAARRLLGMLGEPRVNVLELNLALDALDALGTLGTPGAPEALR